MRSGDHQLAGTACVSIREVHNGTPVCSNRSQSGGIKSEQARGTEQSPLGLFWGGTLGPETETGKNKAIVTCLEVTDKGSGTVIKQIPFIRTEGNPLSAFRCRQVQFTELDTWSLTLCTIPQETRMVPGLKKKIRGPGLWEGKAHKSQISGYHIMNPFGNYFPTLSYHKLLILFWFFLQKLLSVKIIWICYMLLGYLIHLLHCYYK